MRKKSYRLLETQVPRDGREEITTNHLLLHSLLARDYKLRTPKSQWIFAILSGNSHMGEAPEDSSGPLLPVEPNPYSLHGIWGPPWSVSFSPPLSLTLLSLACPSNPLAKYVAPGAPSKSPSSVSGPSALSVSDSAMQSSLLRPCLSPQITSCRCHLGWILGKKILGRRNDSGRNKEECAQLVLDAVQASSIDQGVARKAIHNCWKCFNIFSLPWDKPVAQLRLLQTSSFPNHTFQVGLLWSPCLKTDTYPSIPHQGPEHILSFLFIPQCDNLLVSVYFCQNVNSTLCVFCFPRAQNTVSVQYVGGMNNLLRCQLYCASQDPLRNSF